MIGPNCLGVMVPESNLNASFAASMPLAGRVAFVSQSGALCTAMLDWAGDQALGFSQFHLGRQHARRRSGRPAGLSGRRRHDRCRDSVHRVHYERPPVHVGGPSLCPAQADRGLQGRAVPANRPRRRRRIPARWPASTASTKPLSSEPASCASSKWTTCSTVAVAGPRTARARRPSGDCHQCRRPGCHRLRRPAFEGREACATFRVDLAAARPDASAVLVTWEPGRRSRGLQLRKDLPGR